MSLFAEARVLASLLRGLPRDGEHASRLDRFYGQQASQYDRFRERLLVGRRDLMTRLPIERGDLVVELGGGTGRNADFLGNRLQWLERYEVVDVCKPLLEIARQRAEHNSHICVIADDATRYQPARPADRVVMSYALSMIPQWQQAIDNAVDMLRPGGTVAVVDFYVSATTPRPGEAQHSAFARWFWPRWFGHDGVRLSPEPLEYLRNRLRTLHLGEHSSSVPYLPFAKVPFYVFLGTRT